MLTDVQLVDGNVAGVWALTNDDRLFVRVGTFNDTGDAGTA